jgi:hypothetical protein
MKKAIVILLLLSACSSPRISFQEISHDFGRVDAGTRLSHIFAFKNAGNAQLRIHKIQAG